MTQRLREKLALYQAEKRCQKEQQATHSQHENSNKKYEQYDLIHPTEKRPPIRPHSRYHDDNIIKAAAGLGCHETSLPKIENSEEVDFILQAAYIQSLILQPISQQQHLGHLQKKKVSLSCLFDT
jgi:hypothetical protein